MYNVESELLRLLLETTLSSIMNPTLVCAIIEIKASTVGKRSIQTVIFTLINSVNRTVSDSCATECMHIVNPVKSICAWNWKKKVNYASAEVTTNIQRLLAFF